MGIFTYTEALRASREASLAGVRCDERLVMHHVANGGCLKDFKKAMKLCHPGPAEYESQRRGQRVAKQVVVDVDSASMAACVKATAVLRECFAGNPAAFEHQYLNRIDEGLDQDVELSPNEIWRDERTIFRWWTGMRRSS